MSLLSILSLLLLFESSSSSCFPRKNFQTNFAYTVFSIESTVKTIFCSVTVSPLQASGQINISCPAIFSYSTGLKICSKASLISSTLVLPSIRNSVSLTNWISSSSSHHIHLESHLLFLLLSPLT